MTMISAAMVSQLRQKTDAPMMDCKKALQEAEGDMSRAQEILRVKLGSKATKTSARVTAEGVVAAYISGHQGALIEINCETDFVAKNQDFLDFANLCAKQVVKHHPGDIGALSQLLVTTNEHTESIEDYRATLVGRMGENISIRRFHCFDTQHSLISYLHGTRIGVMVEYTGADRQVGKDVAMHIAAMKPVSLSENQVPADLIEKERTIACIKAKESGKPNNIVEKMIEGSVQKFLREVSLLNQPFVKNDKQIVDQLLKSTNTDIHAFVLYVVGEGIEKKVEDFAKEVAATAANV